MNYKPIIIVAGEPNSIFFELFFKVIKKKIKSPIILIASKKLLIKQAIILKKKINFKIHNEIKIIKKEHHINNLNISSLFVVKKNKTKSSDPGFVEPSTNFELNRINNFLYSKKSFRLYPTFNEICIFSNESNFFISKIE